MATAEKPTKEGMRFTAEVKMKKSKNKCVTTRHHSTLHGHDKLFFGGTLLKEWTRSAPESYQMSSFFLTFLTFRKKSFLRGGANFQEARRTGDGGQRGKGGTLKTCYYSSAFL